jgi:hypothetical protein
MPAGAAATAAQQQHEVIDVVSDSGEGPEAAADAAEIDVDADVAAAAVEAAAAAGDAGPVVLEASSQEAQPGYATASSGSMEESLDEGEETSPALQQQLDSAAAAAGAEEDEEAEMLSAPDSAAVSSSADADYEDVEMEVEGDDGVSVAAAAGGLAGAAHAAAAAGPAAAGVSGRAEQHADMIDDTGDHQQQGSSSASGKAAWRSSGVPAVQICGPPSGLTELVPDDASVPQHLLLRMPLCGVHSGNVAMLKLLSSEDKMHEYDDPAEEPNIDIQCVLLRGVAVQLQQGLERAVTLL